MRLEEGKSKSRSRSLRDDKQRRGDADPGACEMTTRKARATARTGALRARSRFLAALGMEMQKSKSKASAEASAEADLLRG